MRACKINGCKSKCADANRTLFEWVNSNSLLGRTLFEAKYFKNLFYNFVLFSFRPVYCIQYFILTNIIDYAQFQLWM